MANLLKVGHILNMAPGKNRGYNLAFLALTLGAALCIITLYKQPAQWSYVLDYYKDFAIWIVGLTLAGKEAGKVGQKIFGSKLKPEGEK